MRKITWIMIEVIAGLLAGITADGHARKGTG